MSTALEPIATRDAPSGAGGTRPRPAVAARRGSPWALAALACLLAGLALSTPALHGADLAMMRQLNRLTGRWPLADHALHDMTKDTLSSVLMLSLFCLAWSARPGRAERAALVGTFVAAAVCVVLCFVLQAHWPDHPRPLHDAALAFRPPPSIDPAVFSAGMAFPAEHAALLFALAAGIARVWTRLGLACLLLAALLSAARVYLGFVYPSDALAGAGLGLLLVRLAGLDAPAQVAGRVIDWSRRRPGPFAAAGFFLCFGLARLFEDERYIAHGLARALLHHG